MDAHELRESWQGRALHFARGNPQLKTCLLSLFADNYDDTMPFLLHAVYGHAAVHAPFYCSNPKIDKRGCVVADLVLPPDSIWRNGCTCKNAIVFLTTEQMQATFRRLADRLKLDDAERIDLFICVRHWVKADMRLDPAFDRRDPDARRMLQ